MQWLKFYVGILLFISFFQMNSQTIILKKYFNGEDSIIIEGTEYDIQIDSGNYKKAMKIAQEQLLKDPYDIYSKIDLIHLYDLNLYKDSILWLLKKDSTNILLIEKILFRKEVYFFWFDQKYQNFIDNMCQYYLTTQNLSLPLNTFKDIISIGIRDQYFRKLRTEKFNDREWLMLTFVIQVNDSINTNFILKKNWTDAKFLNKIVNYEPLMTNFLLCVNHTTDTMLQRNILNYLENICLYEKRYCVDYALIKDKYHLNKYDYQYYGTQYDEKGHIIMRFDTNDITIINQRRQKIGLLPIKRYK